MAADHFSFKLWLKRPLEDVPIGRRMCPDWRQFFGPKIDAPKFVFHRNPFRTSFTSHATRHISVHISTIYRDYPPVTHSISHVWTFTHSNPSICCTQDHITCHEVHSRELFVKKISSCHCRNCVLSKMPMNQTDRYPKCIFIRKNIFRF
jgi:hypothetical protein